ncbi:L-glyceraldehyde 3-phosphate reductase [Vibrio sp. B1FLJ16]|uniref:L-glyceraldehyde 3-phosphate reductase n=1 Tax=Vibrio sp. B1FLJ16 TaxID=2751178 RepID=UPI0015F6E949|nr:L-glyceraldehyde 3-phosphate reductase [Vibrio sp. B1FLJ16]CAD7817707.1 Aldo/keto reductase family [Vibrio sp. B1FLJ16]CAE6932013.1 Aldo/keto reductase family [Vibrio sp. B1FLJ16]
MNINDHAPIAPYQADEIRYDSMPYRRCGNSGLLLPALSLGLWHNFGEYDSYANARLILRKAFDLGITHFDLANNYGPPYGSAEEAFGRILKQDFANYRNELIISTKAGYDMWPGPYGVGGSRKYLVSSIDSSLKRMNLDYVDVFYHHTPDPDTPLEETISTLDMLVRQGKALYVGLSNYSPEQTQQALKLFEQLGTPCLIHQARYSMFDRQVGEGLLDTLDQAGVGMIAFSPLAQGLLSTKYLNGIPKGSRADNQRSYLQAHLVEEYQPKIKALSNIATERGQSLSQMALAWLLNDHRVSSVLIGASSPEQLCENVAAVKSLEFSESEKERIQSILL